MRSKSFVLAAVVLLTAALMVPVISAICERPIYFNYKGVWTGGHDVVGYSP